MNLKKELGQRIQHLRKSKKLTQEQFAEFIGIDAKNVSKIENGNNYPSAETLTSIAQALNVKIYELFLFEDKIPYTKMREEIIKSLDNNNTVYNLYKTLFG